MVNPFLNTRSFNVYEFGEALKINVCFSGYDAENVNADQWPEWAVLSRVETGT